MNFRYGFLGLFIFEMLIKIYALGGKCYKLADIKELNDSTITPLLSFQLESTLNHLSTVSVSSIIKPIFPETLYTPGNL